MRQSDEELRRLLAGIPRAAAPEIPLGGLMERMALRRRRILLSGIGITVAGALVAILLLSRPPEPPVHLRVKVIMLAEPDVRPPEPGDAPPEVNLP